MVRSFAAPLAGTLLILSHCATGNAADLAAEGLPALTRSSRPEEVPSRPSGQGAATTSVSRGRQDVKTADTPLTADESISPPQNSALELAWNEERLTVRTAKTELGPLLAAIAKSAGISVEKRASLNGLRVSVDLHQVPIAEALHHLLRDFDLVMLYRAGDTRRNVPKAVLIYPRGTGDHMLTAAARDANRERSFAQDQHHPDPERRARYVERSLAKATQHEARSIIEQALNDPDGSVREKAISGALTRAIEIAEADLTQLAHGDPSGTVRFLALSALAHGTSSSEALRVVAEATRADPDPIVRTKAEEILQQFDMQASVPTEVVPEAVAENTGTVEPAPHQ